MCSHSINNIWFQFMIDTVQSMEIHHFDIFPMYTCILVLHDSEQYTLRKFQARINIQKIKKSRYN